MPLLKIKDRGEAMFKGTLLVLAMLASMKSIAKTPVVAGPSSYKVMASDMITHLCYHTTNHFNPKVCVKEMIKCLELKMSQRMLRRMTIEQQVFNSIVECATQEPILYENP